MRIDSSTIGMESERSYRSTSVRSTRVTITEGRAGIQNGIGDLFGNLLQPEEEETGQAKEETNPEDFRMKTMEEMQTKRAIRTGKIRTPEMAETKRQLDSIRKQCMEFLFNLLFYRRHGIREDDIDQTGDTGEAGTQDAVDRLFAPIKMEAGIRTFTFSREYYYEESESTSFSTQGTVKCADGREINFGLNLNMSRSFQEYYREDYAAIEASLCDPLVINLDGNIAELSDQTFFFDIDADGEEDEISRLGSGSGYLALDKNGDGMINDGSELFGTASGNGFKDLAAYDEDGNGFIDEGDSIFSKLKIWVMDENGEQQLYSLQDKGVGAICLQNAATDFTLAGADNETRGVIRSTGFFLYENGGAGTVQHVDVAKYSQAV